MKKSLAVLVFLTAVSRIASARVGWAQQLTDAIAAGIAKAPTSDAPKVTDGIQAIVTIVVFAIAIPVPWYQNKKNLESADLKEPAQIRSFLRAIRAEVNAAWESYCHIRPDFTNWLKPPVTKIGSFFSVKGLSQSMTIPACR